jgi:septal ring factor EnvC (AmiA/AmiB activator)
VHEAEQRLAAVQAEIAASEQSITARARELTEVGRRLEEARQQEAKLRDDLARITQETGAKSSELADAERLAAGPPGGGLGPDRNGGRALRARGSIRSGR